VLSVYFVGDTDSWKTVNAEINTIVDTVLGNMKKSKDTDDEEVELPQHRLSGDGHRRHESSWFWNSPREEKQESANVDDDDTRHKGDTTNDDASLKDWKEQRKQVDLHQKLSHFDDDMSSWGIPEKTVPQPGHTPPQPTDNTLISNDDKSSGGTESIHGLEPPHEKIAAESEHAANKQGDSTGADSVETEAKSYPVHKSSGSVSRSHEEHDISNDHPREAETPDSPAAKTDSVDDENLKNVMGEQLSDREPDDKLVPSETAAGDRMAEQTPPEDSDFKEQEKPAHEKPELAEVFDKSSSLLYQEDMMQRASILAAGTLDKDSEEDDDDDDDEHLGTASRDEEMVVEHDVTDKPDLAAQSKDPSGSGSETSTSSSDKNAEENDEEHQGTVAGDEQIVVDRDVIVKEDDTALQGKESSDSRSGTATASLDENTADEEQHGVNDDLMVTEHDIKAETDDAAFQGKEHSISRSGTAMDPLDEDDDDEHQGTVIKDDETVMQIAKTDDPTFQSVEHSDHVSESSFVADKLPQNEDGDKSEEPPVLHSGNTDGDIVPDSENIGQTFSTLSAIFSAIDAIVDMVRQKSLLVFVSFFHFGQKYCPIKSE